LLTGKGRGSLTAWRTGVVVPLVFVGIGLLSLLSGHATIGFRRYGPHVALNGVGARAVGVAWLAAAAFIHVQFFWDADRRLAEHSAIPKLGAAAVFLGAVGYVVYSTWSV
jgi:hypothetical protein